MTKDAASPAPGVLPGSRRQNRLSPIRRRSQYHASPNPQPPTPSPVHYPTLEPAQDSLLKILADIGDCKRCRLHEARNKIVFGSGNEQARLVFVGEGPGADEDAAGPAVRRPRRTTAHADDRRHGGQGRHPDQAPRRLHLQRGEVPAAGESHAAAGRNGNLRAVPVPAAPGDPAQSDLRCLAPPRPRLCSAPRTA